MQVVNLHPTDPRPIAAIRSRPRPAGRRAASVNRSIVLLDERALTRSSLGRWLMKDLRGYQVKLAGSVEEATVMADGQGNLALVLCHIGPNRVCSPVVAGWLEQLSRELPNVPVAVMADAEDPEAVMSALRAGIRGYIPTSLQATVAVEAVRLICAGDTYAPASSLMRDAPPAAAAAEPGREPADTTAFSPRQIQIIRCLRRGMANKMIAYELSMSQGTVKVHIRNIMKKLCARNRTQIVMMTGELFDDERGR